MALRRLLFFCVISFVAGVLVERFYLGGDSGDVEVAVDSSSPRNTGQGVAVDKLSSEDGVAGDVDRLPEESASHLYDSLNETNLSDYYHSLHRFSGIISKLSIDDMPVASRYWREGIGDVAGNLKRQYLGMLIDQWVKVDALGAAEFALSLSDEVRSEKIHKNFALQTLVYSWFKENPMEAIEWGGEMGFVRGGIDRRIEPVFWKNWVETNFEGAIANIGKIESRGLARYAVEQAVLKFNEGIYDFSRKAEWALGVEGVSQSVAVDRVFTYGALNEPEVVKQWLVEDSERKGSAGIVDATLTGLIRGEREPPSSVVDWAVSSKLIEYGDSSFGNAVAIWAMKQGFTSNLSSYLDRLHQSNKISYDNVAATMIDRVAKQPAMSASIALSMKDEGARLGNLEFILDKWYVEKPDQVSKWVFESRRDLPPQIVESYL